MADGKDKKYQELRKEINRVKTALEKTNSEKLQRDYGKYLKRLKRRIKGGEFKRI